MKKLITDKTCLSKLFRLKSLDLHASTRLEKFRQFSLKVQKVVIPHEKRSSCKKITAEFLLIPLYALLFDCK